MHQEAHRRELSLTTQVLRAMLMAAMYALLGSPLVYAESPRGSLAASSDPDQALIILATLDMPNFHEAIALVQNYGGEVPLAFPPNAFVATLTPRVKRALDWHSTVIGVETEVLDPATFVDFGGQVEEAVRVWNTMFRGVPDVNTAKAPAAPAPQPHAPDFLIPPPEPLDASLEIDAPPRAWRSYLDPDE
jgi:hypothetical protein